MPTLTALLEQFPSEAVLQVYLSETRESWANGHFYLGGHIKLKPDDDITDAQISAVIQANQGALSPANSWEMMSVARHDRNFELFSDTFHRYVRRKRLNGLLRSVVFWLSPARKRATEKVFHPSNLAVGPDGANLVFARTGRSAS